MVLISPKSKMVPTNASTSQPKPFSSSSSSSLELMFATEITPNSCSLSAQPRPNSNSPSDRGRESQDGNVDAGIAHNQQQMGLDSLETGIGVYDLNTDTIIAHFYDDPIPELPGLGHHASTSNGGETGGKGLLKRGIDNAVDCFASALSMDDNAGAKRNRINIGNDDEFGVVQLSAEEDDERGKRKLGDDDDGGVGQRRFTRKEKMKDPLIQPDFGSVADMFLEAYYQIENSDSDNNRNLDINLPRPRDINVAHNGNPDIDQPRPRDIINVAREPEPVFGLLRNTYTERFRRIAKETAYNFAHFTRDVQDDGSSPAPEVEHEIDDCPTPFSTAMKAIKDRGMKNMQKRGAPASITWVSKRNQQDMSARISVPSLLELSLQILANNADAIVSFDGVPDELRHRLSRLLCDSRKMNSHSFELLVSGSPTEIRIKDCSWLTEEQFSKSFQACNTTRLEVLQLDQCGRCIPDYRLHATLAQSPRWLPRLTSLSLSAACRLTDKGLQILVSSAPVLRSINLSQCSLLTSASLNILADSLGSLLKELYLDDCQLIDAALIVPALKELEHLEVLSLAGIQTVCDEFIKDYIIARGHNMKELVLKDCIKLTDASMKVIAEHCPGLCVLDLMNLCKLTDLSIGYLTNSCRALNTLKLCRSPFSDEAIAAFLETTGESLKELSLNNIKKVGHHTTLSLSSHAKNLHTLDLSWCRNLTDNELGLIVDSCFSLRVLKLFGCMQVTDVFLKGHSNPEIQIIGSKMSLLLQHVKVPDPHQGALRYSPVSLDFI